MHFTLTRRAVGYALLLALGPVLAAVAADAPTAPPAGAASVAGGAPAGPAADAPVPIGVGAAGPLAPLPLEPKPFERPSAGISVRYPKGWTGLIRADGEEFVQYVDDVKKQDWTLTVSRRSFPTPQSLMATRDAKGGVVPGIVENTLEALRRELTGAKVLRDGDPTNIGTKDVGMIVLRYTKNGERRLAQHAIIEANDQLFYLLAFSSPGRKDVAEDNNPEERTVDPVEQQAVETFRAILDSAKLLDLGGVRDDQNRRLISTRSLLVNWTEGRLTRALVPERYLRILKDGRDVGYSYVVERVAVQGRVNGLNIGVRTRLMTRVENGKVMPFPLEDSEAWMFCSTDRGNENWSKIVVYDDDGKPKTPQNPWRKVSEIGASKLERRPVSAVPADDPQRHIKRGETGDPGQPWVNFRESHTLDVQFKATHAELRPFTQPHLPPFYLPQAHGALLPRLLPPTEPKGYAFATYVTDMRQVMLRYVDVKPESALPAELVRNGVLRGVPIDDRIGFEGAVTTHWVTLAGEYLGSVTRSTGVVVVPTDEAALKQVWQVADTMRLPELGAQGDEARPQAGNRPADRAAPPPARPAEPSVPGRLPARLPDRQPAQRPQR